jgi:hypothetical protein
MGELPPSTSQYGPILDENSIRFTIPSRFELGVTICGYLFSDSLEAAATPEGSRRVMTAAGFAQAFDTPNGILISLPGLGPERAVLIDRDGCGGIKLWHSHGNINPSEDELTDLVLAALPEGGKRIALGKLSAKAYSTKIGVIAVIWKPVAKPVR